MLLAVLCLVYAFALGWLLDPWLARGDRSRRAPHAWLWVRHATAAGTVLALMTGVLLLAHDVWEHAVTWALHAEKALVHSVYEAPRESPGYRNTAVLLLVILVAALAWVWTRAVLTRRGQVRNHRLLTAGDQGHDVAGVPRYGAPDGPRGATVVPHEQPAIYCVRGTGGRSEIVVTSGAVQRLSRDQLEAALAHEEAHLRRRHHVTVLAAEVCTRALSWIGALRHHTSSVRMLVEQAADDDAARRHGPVEVASALLAMSTPAPVESTGPGLPLSGPGDPSTRIRRLLEGRPGQTSPGVRAGLAGLSILLAGVPLLSSVAPALPLIGSVHGPTATSEHEFLSHHP